MKLTDEYMAGLFDGEGNISIAKAQRRDCKSASYQVHARITMRGQDLMEDVQHEYGGSLRRVRATEKHDEYWSWDVCGEGVVNFCKRVGPHLKVKADQAEMAVEFQKFKRTNPNRPIDDDRRFAYETFFESMAELNKKGPR